MTLSEFVRKIENGRDIMFDVDGRRFTILTWVKDGILICEQNTANESVYPTAEHLINSYKINGKTLSSLASKIRIVDYS